MASLSKAARVVLLGVLVPACSFVFSDDDNSDPVTNPDPNDDNQTPDFSLLDCGNLNGFSSSSTAPSMAWTYFWKEELNGATEEANGFDFIPHTIGNDSGIGDRVVGKNARHIDIEESIAFDLEVYPVPENDEELEFVLEVEFLDSDGETYSGARKHVSFFATQSGIDVLDCMNDCERIIANYQEPFIEQNNIKQNKILGFVIANNTMEILLGDTALSSRKSVSTPAESTQISFKVFARRDCPDDSCSSESIVKIRNLGSRCNTP